MWMFIQWQNMKMYKMKGVMLFLFSLLAYPKNFPKSQEYISCFVSVFMTPIDEHACINWKALLVKEVTLRF